MNALVRDERGITMALTVILVALIGVMGAGILVFATSDLETVAEANQGQRALEMAEAGIESARLQLSTDCRTNANCSTLYDGGSGDSRWSYATALSGCSDLGTAGVCLRDLDQDASTEDLANVQTRYTSGKFRVTATGRYGGTKRRVEAVYEVASTGGLPQGFPQMIWSENTITGRETYLDAIPMYGKNGLDFSSSALLGLTGASLTLNNASAFSGGDVKLRRVLTTLQFTSSGMDQTFGNWNVSPHNTRARSSSASGVGAAGRITPAPPNMNSVNYDSTTTAKFVSSSPSSTQITYPFDENAVASNLGSLTSNLEVTARRQGNYVEVPSSKTELRVCTVIASCGGDSSVQRLAWPTATAANPYPVVYVKFAGGNASGSGTANRVRWSVVPQVDAGVNLSPVTGLTNNLLCQTLQGQRLLAGLTSPLDLSRKGVLVVDNGDFVWQGSTATLPLAPFSGAVVVKSGSTSDAVIGNDNLCIRGPVISDGSMKLDNPAYFGALPSADYDGLPGFTSTFAPALAGWREEYE